MDCQLCDSGPGFCQRPAVIQCPHCGEHLCQECWDESGGAEGCKVFLVARDGEQAWYLKGE